MDRRRLIELQSSYCESLKNDTIAFWTRHGADREHGGFITCLDQTGDWYSTDKSVWFQGRATWLFATLYCELEPRDEWRELALCGWDFLTRHCFAPSGKLYFSVTRDGKPLRMRRYFFSEVFAVMAATAVARMTGDPTHAARAREMFRSLVDQLTLPDPTMAKIDPSTRPSKSLSPIMCLINVAELMQAQMDDPFCEGVITRAVDEVLGDFAKPEEGALMETVAPDGAILDTTEGRCVNPGHAIETAWFLMETARRRGDNQLLQRAAEILDWSLDRGWDDRFGGLLYFADIRDRPSPFLEHDMKLWWPHTEALYAALLAWWLTGDEKYARWYDKIHDWTFAHFPDPDHGEWFGYLHRDGTLSSTLKGSLWKGPFHLPRAQLLCQRLLRSIIDEQDRATSQ